MYAACSRHDGRVWVGPLRDHVTGYKGPIPSGRGWLMRYGYRIHDGQHTPEYPILKLTGGDTTDSAGLLKSAIAVKCGDYETIKIPDVESLGGQNGETSMLHRA